MPMLKGQLYMTNSFHLGFINLLPVDLLLEVRQVDYGANEVELVPRPLQGEAGCHSLRRIARWFETEYPARTSVNCLLKNARAFQLLISQQTAVLMAEQ